nr:reverse transcriptase domain-containing protein [Tanacetum cinerariifolium]
MPSGPDVEVYYSKFTYGPKQTLVDELDAKTYENASSESDSSVETTTSMPAPVENAPKVIYEPKVWTDAPIIEEYESDSDDNSGNGDTAVKASAGNKAHLADYQEFKGGSVAFGGSNGRITGKGKIKAGRLDFEDVYYVKELKHYNLFSVSQMCDNKNKVLFTDIDCLVLSPDFKMCDENQVLPKIPRQNNMYSFNLKNISLSGYLSCLLAKASIDESNKWHRRLGLEEANNSAGIQVIDDQGANLEEINIHDEHFVLPIWSAYSTTVKSSGDKFEKNEKPVRQVEQIFQEELKKLKRQEKEANDALRKEATHDSLDANTNNTNLLNAVSAPVSVAAPFRALNDTEPSYPDDPSMPHLEDIFASLNLPFGKKAIGTKWVYRNKKDERGVAVRNKARLVTQGHRSGHRRGAIDKTLFIKQDKNDIMLVQVYVDDIIFGSTKKSWCDEFEELMKNRFQISSMGKLVFFLGLQSKMRKLVKDEEAADVDVHLYRSMIGSLMYLTAFRPDIMFATIMATFTTEAEYVATAHCCRQVLWIQNQLLEYRGGYLKLLLPSKSYYCQAKVTTAKHRKPTESEGFEQILDFLNGSSIRYVLIASPTIRTSCIKQFYSTDKVKTVDDEVRVQALIDAKRVTIKESSIHCILKLDDEEGISCLANNDIFTGLANMGYEKISDKLTFYKAFFSLQWKFLIHTILQCLSVKTTSWNKFSSTVASTIIFLATNQKFNFSRYLLLSLVKNIEAGVPFYKFPRVGIVKAAKLFTEVVTTAEPTTVAAQVPKASALKRRRSVVIQDPEEKAASVIVHTDVKSKDKGKGILIEEPKPLKYQAQIKQDEAFARQLEAELTENINWNDVIEQVKKNERQNNEEDPPEVSMIDNRTMAQLLQAPTVGKSKVRQSRTKAVVVKVNSNSSTSAISSDVAELKDMVRALLLDKKNQSSAQATSHTPAPIKAVESNCVTCGGTHSYQNCPATSGNVYQDNINDYVSQAAAANYNQGNAGFRPQMVANQIRPPGFPPVQNNQNNFNRGNNFTQNRGGNFNQSAFDQSQLHRPQVNQAPAYQASIPQTQNVSQTDFERYVKANDAVLRNIQSQGSGTLPGNTVTNPKEDLKGTEATKDPVQTSSPQSTAHVQPPVTQSETSVSEPIAAPVSASMPNLKPSIPYLSMRDDERRRDQANEQIEKFYEIFKDMSFEISFTDALILMPKFASTLKALIENKEKLNEMARTPMNEHCSTVILNKLPKKLGDPGKFLIPCEFPGIDECLALADLGASINLMPLSVWKELSLPELTPTCMTLELADRSVSKPIDPSYYDPEGDIQMLEAILNSDPAPSLPNPEQSVPSFTNELKACEAETIKSSGNLPRNLP